jgi:hypothetical protein
MQTYLDSAYAKALEMKGFKPFERMNYFTTSNDYDTYGVRYVGNTLYAQTFSKVFDTTEWSIQCETLSMIREVRIYFHKDKSWIVCALGCPEGNPISEDLRNQGIVNAKNSFLGMTYVTVDWHGFTNDVLLGP